jgi:hypothetical protein
MHRTGDTCWSPTGQIGRTTVFQFKCDPVRTKALNYNRYKWLKLSFFGHVCVFGWCRVLVVVVSYQYLSLPHVITRLSSVPLQLAH